MSDTSTLLRQYPPTDKRKKPIIQTSPSLASISEKIYEKRKSITVDQFIESQVAVVSKSNIERWINSITSFHNRHSKSIYIHQVANWLKKELEISGYKDKEKINDGNKDKHRDVVDFHRFGENGLELKNVICQKEGQKNKIIIVCGHYDTVLGDNIEDAVSRSPGANDNASGVAAILELARILCSVNLKYTLRFVLFSGEEQDLMGSRHYAYHVTRKNEDIGLVINLDMIGRPGFLVNKNIIQIDVDKKFENEPSCNKVDENNEDSEKLADIMDQIATSYTDLIGTKGSVYASDYCSFEEHGYVVIGAYDGSAEHVNPDYHSCSDVQTKLDMKFLTSVTKMVLATILHIDRLSLLE